MSSNKTSRRKLLQAGVGVGLGALGVGAASATARPDLFRVTSEGGGFGGYEFTVGGSIKQLDSGDLVDEYRAEGHVGPRRGRDTFRYSGGLLGVTLAGPVSAAVREDGDWRRITQQDVRQPSRALTAADFDSRSGTNVIEIHGGGGRPSIYEFSVTGGIRQRDAGDFVDDGHARGHVGSLRGVDTFEYWGEVTDFRFTGPGTVVHNGTTLDPARPSNDAVTFRDCHTVSVTGDWAHVGIEAMYPSWTDYLSWGGVDGGPRTFRTPADDDPPGYRLAGRPVRRRSGLLRPEPDGAGAEPPPGRLLPSALDEPVTASTGTNR